MTGKVAEISGDGKLITDIEFAYVSEAVGNAEAQVAFGGHETVGLFEASHGQPEATMVASVGDSGRVEIEIVGMDLAGMLGIPVGTQVEVQW